MKHGDVNPVLLLAIMFTARLTHRSAVDGATTSCALDSSSGCGGEGILLLSKLGVSLLSHHVPA